MHGEVPGVAMKRGDHEDNVTPSFSFPRAAERCGHPGEQREPRSIDALSNREKPAT